MIWAPVEKFIRQTVYKLVNVFKVEVCNSGAAKKISNDLTFGLKYLKLTIIRR
jgi:hypothetical protein